MRKKVREELQLVEAGNLVEVKFIDASRSINVKRNQTNKNTVFATYKRVVGEYVGTFIDRLYGEEFFVIITEVTNGKVDVVSIPKNAIQRVSRLRRDKRIKEVSNVGDPMLAGSVNSKYYTSNKGVGESDG